MMAWNIHHLWVYFLFSLSSFFPLTIFLSFKKNIFGDTDGGMVPHASWIRPCHLSPTMARAEVRKFEEIVPLDGRKLPLIVKYIN